MYLTIAETLGIMVVLVVASTLVITTAIANARLIRSRDEWRRAYHNYKFATEAEAMNKSYYWDSESQSWQYAKASN